MRRADRRNRYKQYWDGEKFFTIRYLDKSYVGVTPTGKTWHPPLERVVSQRGEVHYV